jgi:hypothetical protein
MGVKTAVDLGLIESGIIYDFIRQVRFAFPFLDGIGTLPETISSPASSGGF